MSLHVAVVIETFNPAAGGAERSTAQIVAELLKRGHRVTVLAGFTPPGIPGSDGSFTSENFELRAFSHRRSSGVLRLWRFAKWARRELDELESSGGGAVSLSITNAVAAAVMQPRGGTVIETLARNVATRAPRKRRLKKLTIRIDPKQQLLLKLERENLRSPGVRTIVAVGSYVVRQLEKHYGIAGDKVVLIPNASVTPQRDPAQAAQVRADLRAGLGLGEATTVFAFVAMNPRLKGLDTLWRAAEILRDRGVDFAVLLAGAMGHRQGVEASRRKLTQQMRVLGRVNDASTVYLAADVTVLPTFYDPSSKVVIESLMLGRPAISTSYNGASDFIEGYGGPLRGRTIGEADDAGALATAMAELCDKAERNRCAAACAGLAEQLTMARHVDALERVLEQAAG